MVDMLLHLHSELDVIVYTASLEGYGMIYYIGANYK